MIPRRALTICTVLAGLAACGGPSAMPQNSLNSAASPDRSPKRAKYEVIYSFGKSSADDGTVFAITSSGAESIVHNFAASGDGTYPQSGLLNVNGTLYGTTEGGGGARFGNDFRAYTLTSFAQDDKR